MIPSSDLLATAMSRLAYQYRESPKLQGIIQLFVDETTLARDAALAMELLRRIDTASGDGLDGLGQILGQPREVSGVVPIDYFAYHDGAGGPAAEGFGDLTDPEQGLRFRSIFESPTANALLGDNEYRRMLRAKIVRNQTRATPEDVIASIQAVLDDSPVTPVHIIFTPPATATAEVQRVLSAEELAILNALGGIRGQLPVIPRPPGVNLTIVGL
jgi:hypothetical protein